jgi:hypothetical protein
MMACLLIRGKQQNVGKIRANLAGQGSHVASIAALSGYRHVNWHSQSKVGES